MHPPTSHAALHHGLCVWFTGLSGSGKTTTATALARCLTQAGHSVVSVDGDVFRATQSPRLGFSREDRDLNVRRIAETAAVAVHEGHVAVVAAVSPYREMRARARHLVGEAAFVEVFVDTPLEVCEARDPKGLYARARRGDISGLTGVDAPYEKPLDPEIVLDTVRHSVSANAQSVLDFLVSRALLNVAVAP
jgi:sulfate adenylyltransferase